MERETYGQAGMSSPSCIHFISQIKKMCIKLPFIAREMRFHLFWNYWCQITNRTRTFTCPRNTQSHTAEYLSFYTSPRFHVSLHLLLVSVSVHYYFWFLLLSENTLHMGEGTPRKLATATQQQFPRIVISLSWTRVTEWGSTNWGNGNATPRKTEKLNFQAAEHASLLTIALPRGFLVSAVP
jgi:hypothetical protein